MFTHQVRIGPSFFESAFRDYSNWQWAWIREILQNCQDAPKCTEIDISIKENDEDTLVTVSNNGLPMTKEILLDKFLSLGESGKRFEGTVGGFGKAKELIAFCHKNWQIETGNLIAKGIGGEFTLNEIEYFHGTRTTVLMKGKEAYHLESALMRYCSFADWPGNLTLNGLVIDTNLSVREHRKDFSFGKLYNSSDLGKIIYRINGIPMFYRWLFGDDLEGFILELNGSQALTSNRDGLVYEASREVDVFIDQLSTNKLAAFRDESKEKKLRFEGYKLQGKSFDINTNIEVSSNLFNILLDRIESIPVETSPISEKLRPEFYVKSDKDFTIENKFMPDTFTKKTKSLVTKWVNLLVEIATLTKFTGRFSVGFIFSDSCYAQYELEAGNHILYINPEKVTDDWSLISSAIHEFTHMEGYHQHNESYASRLTDLISVLLANYRNFARILKTKEMRF